MKKSSGFCSEVYGNRGIRVSRPPSVFSWDSVAKTLDRSKQLESPLPVEMHRAHASSSVTQRPPAASHHRPRTRPPTGCTRCGSTFYEGAGRPQPWTRRTRAVLAATAPVFPPAKDTAPCGAARLKRAELACTDPILPSVKATAPRGAAGRRRAALAATAPVWPPATAPSGGPHLVGIIFHGAVQGEAMECGTAAVRWIRQGNMIFCKLGKSNCGCLSGGGLSGHVLGRWLALQQTARLCF